MGAVIWCGGTCVVFFQAALLFGYLFTHGLIGRLGIERYRFVHLALIFLPLFFLADPWPWAPVTTTYRSSWMSFDDRTGLFRPINDRHQLCGVLFLWVELKAQAVAKRQIWTD